ncbi:hypothetical protein ABN028_24430 [Actinopolymorpha sp. B17G11]|uniref:hypothetical protein n=1 Tax=Actinopolymorpha sp. B17G11 TaxID=3160861 RepID=UPI0032E3E511
MATRKAIRFVTLLADRVGLAENRAGASEDALAQGRRGHDAVGADEEIPAKLDFQRVNGAAHTRLAHVQAARGFGETTRIRNCDQRTKLRFSHSVHA